MRLTPKKKTSKRFLMFILLIVSISATLGIIYLINGFSQNDKDQDVTEPSTQPTKNNTSGSETSSEESEQAPEESFIHIRIAAAGDIMFHDTQLESAYDDTNKRYNFTSVFEDVKPILSAANMTIANFETTTAGPSRPYTGYPVFNSPDEVIDAIQYAGVDVLTTANNHSLDTGSEGLKRTVKTLREKGFDTVGTYDEKPDSRVLIKDVDGIKLAILSYTESTNGLGSQYPREELDAMLNLMEKDKIIHDIQEAKKLEADFIITFMHWGEEYMEEPNDKQVEFAQMMAEEGVDLILGSHPHVIQKSEVIETDGHQTFVVYSMGNFISNQRKETLGSDRELTEDGIIINFDIRKNEQTNETTIENVEYVPTWVYRHKEEGQSKYTYRILPIENFLISDEISEAYKRRMERSFDATVSKMEQTPFGDH